MPTRNDIYGCTVFELKRFKSAEKSERSTSKQGYRLVIILPDSTRAVEKSGEKDFPTAIVVFARVYVCVYQCTCLYSIRPSKTSSYRKRSLQKSNFLYRVRAPQLMPSWHYDRPARYRFRRRVFVR